MLSTQTYVKLWWRLWSSSKKIIAYFINHVARYLHFHVGPRSPTEWSRINLVPAHGEEWELIQRYRNLGSTTVVGYLQRCPWRGQLLMCLPVRHQHRSRESENSVPINVTWTIVISSTFVSSYLHSTCTRARGINDVAGELVTGRLMEADDSKV